MMQDEGIVQGHCEKCTHLNKIPTANISESGSFVKSNNNRSLKTSHSQSQFITVKKIGSEFFGIVLIILSSVTLLSKFSSAQEIVRVDKELILMGSRFELSAIADQTSQAESAIEAGIKEIERIEKLISSWDPKSQTSKINSSAGLSSVRVDRELYNLIFRSKKISRNP